MQCLWCSLTEGPLAYGGAASRALGGPPPGRAPAVLGSAWEGFLGGLSLEVQALGVQLQVTLNLSDP